MAQPQRRNTTRIVLIVVACVLAVCCVGGGIGAYFAYRVVSNSVGPPRQATEAFIADLSSGDAQAAYGRLCASTRASVSQDKFASMLGNRRPTGSEIVGTNVSNVNGTVTATITARMTYPDGFAEQHIFHLVQEDGAWKICGDPY